MKYFKPEYWIGLQSLETKEEADKKWDKSIKEYNEQLNQLQPRLSKKNFDFFNHISLHDGIMISFKIIDETAKIMKKNGSYRETKRFSKPITIHIEVLSEEYLYHLKFRKVMDTNFSFSLNEILFGGYQRTLGDWGYDELTPEDDVHLKYEILFSSGATIKIIFKDFSYIRKKFIK